MFCASLLNRFARLLYHGPVKIVNKLLLKFSWNSSLNLNLTQILNPEYVEVTGNGVKTYAQLFNELYALVDISKVTNHSYLRCTLASGDKLFYRLKSFRTNNTPEYEASLIASGKLCVDVLEIDADSNYSRKVEGQNIAYITTTVVPNGEKYRLYYR